jgi:hypothetical protein
VGGVEVLGLKLRAMRKERTSGAEALAGRFFYGTAEAVPFVESRCDPLAGKLIGSAMR